MARFENNPSRINYTIQQEGREYRQRLVKRSQVVFTTLLNLLPSNYKSTIQGPNYTVELKAVAVEIAKVELALEDVSLDTSYEKVRSDFLYSIVGYLVFLNDRLPVTSFDDVEFKRFLLSVIKIYFQGSIPTSIQQGVGLFASDSVTIRENFLLVRQGASGVDISDQFSFTIDLEGASANIFAADYNIRLVLDILRPAHTLYRIRYIFRDHFDPNPGAGDLAGQILDSYRMRMANYYYEDFRVYPDGVRNVDRLGVKHSSSVVAEDHSKDF